MDVNQRVERRTTVERSRFYALLFPVRDDEELERALGEQRRARPRARHHCWAARYAGPDGRLVERSKDDGEVGRPGRVLLELLRRRELTGGLVVSRIFGGVKLGVGGVSRAFRDAGEGVVAAYLDRR